MAPTEDLPADDYIGRSWGRTPVNSQNFEVLRHRVRSDKKRKASDAFDTDSDQTLKHAIRDKRVHPWLKTVDRWEKGFPKGWQAVRVLGKGGFGVAGHWKYVSKELPLLDSVEAKVKDIVVKQSKGDASHGLREESKFLEELTRTGSRHFPQLYGRVQRDVGHGTESKMDPANAEVHRIFIEFCPGGSMDGFLHQETVKRANGGRRIPEVVLWSIFHCFAKAVSVLDQGDEQAGVGGPQSDLHPWSTNHGIVHFDFKPANSLIGLREPNTEHQVFPTTKIADFGLSEYMDKNWQFDAEVLRDHSQHGTIPWRAPEQVRRPVGTKSQLARKDRKYGACTNIYQIGCVMWQLIVLNRSECFPIEDDCFYSQLTLPHKHETIGQEIENVTYYSKTLRGLVLECLFQVFRYRPSPSELIARTRSGLRAMGTVEDIPEAVASANASRNNVLQRVNNMLLEQWHGPNLDRVWRRTIPKMQVIAGRRERQLIQITKAQGKYDELQAKKAAKAKPGDKGADQTHKGDGWVDVGGAGTVDRNDGVVDGAPKGEGEAPNPPPGGGLKPGEMVAGWRDNLIAGAAGVMGAGITASMGAAVGAAAAAAVDAARPHVVDAAQRGFKAALERAAALAGHAPAPPHPTGDIRVRSHNRGVRSIVAYYIGDTPPEHDDSQADWNRRPKFPFHSGRNALVMGLQRATVAQLHCPFPTNDSNDLTLYVFDHKDRRQKMEITEKITKYGFPVEELSPSHVPHVTDVLRPHIFAVYTPPPPPPPPPPQEPAAGTNLRMTKIIIFPSRMNGRTEEITTHVGPNVLGRDIKALVSRTALPEFDGKPAPVERMILRVAGVMESDAEAYNIDDDARVKRLMGRKWTLEIIWRQEKEEEEDEEEDENKDKDEEMDEDAGENQDEEHERGAYDDSQDKDEEEGSEYKDTIDVDDGIYDSDDEWTI